MARLLAAARRPVHAYLFHGPPGWGKRAAARGLAAALLCPDGGCGGVQLVSACTGRYPPRPGDRGADRGPPSTWTTPARSPPGPSGARSSPPARSCWSPTSTWRCRRRRPCSRRWRNHRPRPCSSCWPTTCRPSLATIVSRCVQVPFTAVAPAAVAEWLVGRGVDGDGGRVGGRRVGRQPGPGPAAGRRSRVRRAPAPWRSVPSRLDGTGAAAVDGGRRAAGLADGALAPLREQHARELAGMEEQAEATGARGVPGRKGVEDRHKREERRWRTDDLRMGLAALADAYRDRLVATVAAGAGRITGCRDRAPPGRCTCGRHRAGLGGPGAQRARGPAARGADGRAVRHARAEGGPPRSDSLVVSPG